MKRHITYLRGIAAPLLLVALSLTGCSSYELNPPPVAMIKADAGNVVDAREIVALVPNAFAAATLKQGAVARGFLFREEKALNGLGLQMLRFEFPQPLNGPGAIAVLEEIEPSATAGINHAYAPAAHDSRLDYANGMMHWPDHACHALGPIGMIDTGVDASIPELSGAKVVAMAFHRGAPAPTRHGTEVASVLADPRRLSGVTLYSASVIGTSARGQQESGVDSLLDALDWMAGNGVKLVNISLAGPYNKLLDRGIDTAEAHGMTIVAAVGNDGAGANPRFPAALENVVGVTAVDAARSIYPMAVRGYPDIAAPGVDVMLTTGGKARFVTGTSIATPFVTARIASDPALYRQTAHSLRTALAATAVDLGTPGRDPVFGAGLLMADPACRAE
ncbi:S8 family serine peptidase [Pseudooceanicola nanhaiensis]|uniref:S8 family serine peptidase n=1 Tax=Pseudooceanicola nanhaiensis TaxID=375761 RepID=UPI001CD3224C|nr:S8 family serine peptidase [Pseudooceanicola nanhaiensis]MCA0920670.1 S8 family serine peptidase [Pseudooceanicola nanhaiensis]